MYRSLHHFRHVLGLTIGLLLRGRQPAHAPELKLQNTTEAEKAEVAKILWRAAMVQMKAVNTATAWPLQGRRKMRSEAEARLNRYFAQVERVIAGTPSADVAKTDGLLRPADRFSRY
jgi:hypothetical protein